MLPALRKLSRTASSCGFNGRLPSRLRKQRSAGHSYRSDRVGHYLRLRLEQLESRCLLSGIQSTGEFAAQAVVGGQPLAPEVSPGYHTSHTLFGDGSVAHPFATSGPTGLSPAQVRKAYGFDQVTFGAGNIPGDGAGTTIAIVAAFDNPKIESDLRQFSQQFGLPDPPSFSKVNQTGGTGLPPANNIWAREIALDVQWAHAIAPKANILLVVADNNSIGNLNTAIAYAARQPGVVVVSMSFGGGEFPGQSTSDTVFVTPPGHPGVTFVASSGDFGAPPSQPAISPNVLAVGGTTLTLDGAGNVVSETGWSGSGGGISAYVAQPPYQAGIVTQSTTMRTNPDVAYNSNPNTGFSIYDSFNNPASAPWSQVGGTSAAAPQWAALIAIANQGRAIAGLPSLDGRNDTLPKLYSLPASSYNDTTSGGSTGSPFYFASAGYDLVTGRGSPKANRVIADLVGLGVSSSVPASGSFVASPPANYVIQFSAVPDPASLQASDLTVNGVPASSVSLDGSGKTATFTFAASPVTTQGPHLMKIAGGAIYALGSPTTTFSEFTGTFFLDSVSLQIKSTIPTAGGTFVLPGTFQFDVEFNEAVDPVSVQPSDLVLTGGSVIGVSLVNNNSTARFTIIASAEGTLTAAIAAGAVRDTFGNPNPGTFTAAYLIDSISTPLPTPLAARPPFGSLVYESSGSGTVSSGDSDMFSLPLDAGQTVSVVVTPGSIFFQPTVAMLDPAGAALGSVPASAPGRAALLQTIPTTTTGIYTFVVAGGSSTTGDYTIKVSLNAALESETHLDNAPNDSRATAQDLNTAMRALDSQAGEVTRGAVLGSNPIGAMAPASAFDFEGDADGFVIDNSPSPGSAPGLWHHSTGRGNQAGHSATRSFYYGTGEGPNGGGNYQTDSRRNKGSLTSPPILIPPSARLNFNYVLQTERATLVDSASVLISKDNFATSTIIAGNTLNLAERSVWGPSVPIDLSAYVGQTVQFRWVFDTVDEIFNQFEGWYIDDVQITVPSIWNDYYSLSLAAGDGLSVGLSQLAGSGTSLAIEDATGVVLASSATGSTNVDRAISNFVATSGGTYYVRVTGSLAASYNLVLTKNAAFDREANDSFAAPQPLASNTGALGAITTPDFTADWYSFDVASVQHPVNIWTTTPGDGVGQFVNILNPRLELYSPTNTLVASGTPLADGRNERIDFLPPVAGTYRVRISTENGTPGEYFLAKTFAPIVTNLVVSPSVKESESATVSGAISDPDGRDAHTVTISWGPGEELSVVELPAGATTFSVPHVYADDQPTTTSADVYPVSVKVTDRHGAAGVASASVVVNNVAPVIKTLPVATSIQENGAYVLTGTFHDAGRQDSHVVTIQWGGGGAGQASEGSTSLTTAGPNPPGTSLLALGNGDWQFTASHVYLDDNPTSSSGDDYQITVSVADDDSGAVSGSTSVRVNNAPPALTGLAAAAIDESGTTTLTGNLADPGTLDTFSATIDWGNGTETISNLLPGNFRFTRKYVDDNSADAYPISLTIVDDDGGLATAATSVIVRNTPPIINFVTISDVLLEGAEVKVSAAVSDAAETHDALSYEWRVIRGSSQTPLVTDTSGPNFAFVPDNDGLYRIELTARDDDGGATTIDRTISVANVAPLAGNLSLAGQEDLPLNLTLVGTDVPGDSLNFFFVSLPVHGGLTGSGGNWTYTPAANYHGSDQFTYQASDGAALSAIATATVSIDPVNDAPVVRGDFRYTIAEDAQLKITASGLLSFSTDVENDPLTAKLADGPAHGTVVLRSDGTFDYSPASDYNGPDSFTYRAEDGSAASGLSTVTLSVTPVNDLPSFTKGSDPAVTDESGAQVLAGWASGITAGPLDEASQKLTFVVTTDSAHLFTTLPQVDATGNLTFTPRQNTLGKAQVTVRLLDDGGLIQGAEPVVTQTFTIDVAKPRRWHNVRQAFDVNGDGNASVIDALLVINFLNGDSPGGPGLVPADAAVGAPYGFIDTNGENTIAPIDALLVINQLQSPASGEGESATALTQDATASPHLADILNLLAHDVAERQRRRRTLPS